MWKWISFMRKWCVEIYARASINEIGRSVLESVAVFVICVQRSCRPHGARPSFLFHTNENRPHRQKSQWFPSTVLVGFSVLFSTLHQFHSPFKRIVWTAWVWVTGRKTIGSKTPQIPYSSVKCTEKHIGLEEGRTQKERVEIKHMDWFLSVPEPIYSTILHTHFDKIDILFLCETSIIH